MLVPHIHIWPRALVLMAQPQNIGVSLKNAASTVLMMWELIEVEIVDTKPADSTLDWCEAGSPTDRVILSAIYASTALFLLSDPSPGITARGCSSPRGSTKRCWRPVRSGRPSAGQSMRRQA